MSVKTGGTGSIVAETSEHVLALCSGCISHRLCPLMDFLGASFYQSLSCVWGFFVVLSVHLLLTTQNAASVCFESQRKSKLVVLKYSDPPAAGSQPTFQPDFDKSNLFKLTES